MPPRPRGNRLRGSSAAVPTCWTLLKLEVEAPTHLIEFHGLPFDKIGRP